MPVVRVAGLGATGFAARALGVAALGAPTFDVAALDVAALGVATFRVAGVGAPALGAPALGAAALAEAGERVPDARRGVAVALGPAALDVARVRAGIGAAGGTVVSAASASTSTAGAGVVGSVSGSLSPVVSGRAAGTAGGRGGAPTEPVSASARVQPAGGGFDPDRTNDSICCEASRSMSSRVVFLPNRDRSMRRLPF